jgi:predicted Zn-dependent peptidase
MNKENFFRKKLENGMSVIFEQRKGSGVVSIAFVVKQGGIHESVEEKGIFHFIEHMLFKGTKKRNAKRISEEIERNGGVLNGYTEDEFTFYFCKMPSDKINIALNVLSDIIKNPLFDEKEIEKERQVIFEEIKIYKDNPRLHVQDKITSCLFEGSAGMSLAGTEETLKKIDRKKILEKFKNTYASENIFLCAVGDCNFDFLCDYCEKNFEKSKFYEKEKKISKICKKETEKRKGIDQTNLVFAYHVPVFSDEKHYASQVLACLMAGGMSSRLWQEIREKRNLAYSVNGNCHSGKRIAYITITVGTGKQNAEKVRKIIIEEFEKVAKMLDEKELSEVKEQLIGNSKISREDSQGEMTDLLSNEVFERAEKTYEYEENIKKVNLEDVKELAKIKDYSFFSLVPE